MPSRFRHSFSGVVPAVSLMFFFYTLFDGLLTYLLPIRITSLGFSTTSLSATHFNGLFMAAYTLPVFFVNLFLLPIGFISSPIPIIFFVFLASLISSVAWPAIDGSYAGYIIGPIFAGFMADFVGVKQVFLPLIIINLFVVLVLLKTTPKAITVRL